MHGYGIRLAQEQAEETTLIHNSHVKHLKSSCKLEILSSKFRPWGIKTAAAGVLACYDKRMQWYIN
jgi:hypothetical protein